MKLTWNRSTSVQSSIFISKFKSPFLLVPQLRTKCDPSNTSSVVELGEKRTLHMWCCVQKVRQFDVSKSHDVGCGFSEISPQPKIATFPAKKWILLKLTSVQSFVCNPGPNRFSAFTFQKAVSSAEKFVSHVFTKHNPQSASKRSLELKSQRKTGIFSGVSRTRVLKKLRESGGALWKGAEVTGLTCPMPNPLSVVQTPLQPKKTLQFHQVSCSESASARIRRKTGVKRLNGPPLRPPHRFYAKRLHPKPEWPPCHLGKNPI